MATNAVPVINPTQVDSKPIDGVIASGSFARPAIGVYQGVITVAAEGAGMGSIWKYTLGVNGKWSGGEAVKGSAQTADRVYVPDVAGGVVSFRFGPKTGGVWKGPGLIMPDGKVIRTQLTTGAARLAQDSKGVIIMSKDASWGRVNADGSIGQRGRFAGMSTGEKISFDCSGDQWAVGMGGYSKQYACVAVGTEKGGKLTSVASYKTYPDMSSDLLYCSVKIHGSNVWFATSYNGRLMVNRVTAGRARWPITALKDMGPCVAGDRCPPRLVALSGRVYAIYEAPGRKIMMQAIPKGKAAQIATGSQPGADDFGHVVYVDGGLKIKVL